MLDILGESPVVEKVTGKRNIDFSGASAEHVAFSYGAETILDDVSLRVPEGSVSVSSDEAAAENQPCLNCLCDSGMCRKVR